MWGHGGHHHGSVRQFLFGMLGFGVGGAMGGDGVTVDFRSSKILVDDEKDWRDG